MSVQDIRWQQRFVNYKKALSRLTQALEQYDETAEALIKGSI